jgi:hypothetical protein
MALRLSKEVDNASALGCVANCLLLTIYNIKSCGIGSAVGVVGNQMANLGKVIFSPPIISIEQRNIFAFGHLDCSVAGSTHSAIGLVQESDCGIGGGQRLDNLATAVSRAVINDNNLEGRNTLSLD